VYTHTEDKPLGHLQQIARWKAMNNDDG
jgi:hypothetical protein